MTEPSGLAPRIINGQPFGAWVVKANPTISDVNAVLADGGAGITGWCVQRNYRAALIAPGDPVSLDQRGKQDHRLGFLGRRRRPRPSTRRRRG